MAMGNFFGVRVCVWYVCVGGSGGGDVVVGGRGEGGRHGGGEGLGESGEPGAAAGEVETGGEGGSVEGTRQCGTMRGKTGVEVGEMV